MRSADAPGMPVETGSPVAIRDTGRESGTGTPVLLLHASASTGGQWNALVERLVPHRRVLVADLAGCGASGDWYAGAPALEREAAALAERIAAIDPALEGPIHLVGHSFGGAIATRLALLDPARVRSLTAIEPVLFHLLRDGTAAERRLHAGVARLAARMRAATATDAMADFVDFWNGAGTFAALKPAVRDALVPQAARVAANFASLDAERFPLAALRALSMPALLLMGGASRPETQRIVSRMFDTLPAAALGIVGDAGHMLPITHRDVVNDRIAAHLDEIDGRGAFAVPATRHAA
ncbi:MAG: alpha/beta hydrolase [Dongiaceae bacterium]